MGNNSNNNGGGMGLGTILFLIFLVLKLTNYIDWSWWWVSAPLWVTAILYIVIAIIMATYLQKRRGRRK
jgi:uncharacterized integral membrane protein